MTQHADRSDCPYRNPELSPDARAADLLERMTLGEKIAQLQCMPRSEDLPQRIDANGIGSLASPLRALTAGEAAETANRIQRHMRDNTRLGIPVLIHEEALHGLLTNRASSFPQPIGLAASFNPALVARVAAAIAEETRARGIRHVLSPTINIARDVRWGRTHETYGEDPLLTARMAVAFCTAFEQRGVATTIKHFAANIGDGGRDSQAIHASQRLLEEVYFPAFRAAIAEAGASSVMTAYNSLDGLPCSTSPYLLSDVLRKQWGFTGLVVSDYNAIPGAHWEHRTQTLPAQTTAAAIKAGVDLEFPNAQFYATKEVQSALDKGLIAAEDLDATVGRILKLKFRLGLFEDADADPAGAEAINDCAAHRELARQAARESIVLLTNPQSVLPLAADRVQTLGLFGPAADPADLGSYSGYGMTCVSILEGITAKLGADRVAYRAVCSNGAPQYDTVPAEHLLADAQGTAPGLAVEYFDSHVLSAEPARRGTDAVVDVAWKAQNPFGEPVTEPFAARWTGFLRAPASGEYVLRTSGLGTARVWLNGRLIIDTSIRSPGQRCFAHVRLEAGRRYPLRVTFLSHFDNASWPKDRAIRLQWSTPRDYADDIREACEIAETCDAAVVAAGLVEGEDHDRAMLALPQAQEALIEALCATGTPVVVLVHAGSAVTMRRWIDQVAAVVQVWYPGEEGGTAVADVLFGEYNPAGRLPITFPQHTGQCPLYYNPKPTGRSYDYENLSGWPLFAFGHGLSYTAFEYANLAIAPTTIPADGSVHVSLDVRNAGARDGEDVVQLYVRDRVGSTARPVRELKDFRRVCLAAGQTTRVDFTLAADQLRMLDTSLHWTVEPGAFDVMIGASSADIRLAGAFHVV